MPLTQPTAQAALASGREKAKLRSGSVPEAGYRPGLPDTRALSSSAGGADLKRARWLARALGLGSGSQDLPPLSSLHSPEPTPEAARSWKRHAPAHCHGSAPPAEALAPLPGTPRAPSRAHWQQTRGHPSSSLPLSQWSQRSACTRFQDSPEMIRHSEMQ